MPKAPFKPIIILLSTLLVPVALITLACQKETGSDNNESSPPLSPAASSSIKHPPSRHTIGVNTRQVPVVRFDSGKESVPITGEATYPTPLVLHNLGLGSLLRDLPDKSFTVTVKSRNISAPSGAAPATMVLNPDRIEGMKILSLGEGYSGLVPFLRRMGAEAFGLDLCYDPTATIPNDAVGGEFIAAYRTAHHDYLIFGDATDLTSVGSPHFSRIPDSTFQLVLSHMLFEYLDRDDQMDMLREAVRVTAPGGSVRIVSTTQFQLTDFEEILEGLRHSGRTVEGFFLRLETRFQTAPDTGSMFSHRYSFDESEFEELLRRGVRPPPVQQNLEMFVDLFVIKKIS